MNESGVFQETKDDCGFCCRGRMEVNKDFIDNFQTIKALVYYEHIKSLDDIQDFIVNTKIAQGGSGEISCPACKQKGGVT